MPLIFRLMREVSVATLLTTSGNWTGGYVAAVAAKGNGGAASDPAALNRLVWRGA